MSRKNAIERRLELVEEEWFAFTDDASARVGRWRLDADGIKLVEVFLEQQTLPDTAVPDFFLRLAVPFTDPLQHGLHLREAFLAEIEAAADDIREAGYDPAWPVPPLDPAQDDVGHFLMCLHAFQVHFRSKFDRVVAIQMPAPMENGHAWPWWLERLLTRNAPESIRFMVFDPVEAPVLDDLAARHPPRLKTLAPELDMVGAVDELVRETGGNTPADVFRRLFVGMSTAAARGNVGGALALAASAVKVAEGQGWRQQVAVVHMAAGTLLLGAGRARDAMTAYGAAESAAAASHGSGDAGSDQVLVQAKLAQAGALLGSGDMAAAARGYEAAVAEAEKLPDPNPILLLEGRRMAAYCQEQAGQPDAAWHHLGMAIKAANRIDPGMRANSTLPFAAQALLRLTTQSRFAGYRGVVEGRLAELLGPDWHGIIARSIPA